MSQLQVPVTTLPEIWETNAICYPEKEAVICGENSRTWRELDQDLNRVANLLLRSGLRKGDKVAVVMSNSIDMLVVMFGALRAGACLVPLSTLLTPAQIGVLIEDCGARFAFVSASVKHLAEPFKRDTKQIEPHNWFSVGFEAEGWRHYDGAIAEVTAARPDVDIEPEDDCVIIYSSGTTGLPKGILHTHRSRHQLAHVSAVEMRFRQDSCALTTTALYSNGTFLMMLPAMFVGATLVILDKFSPKAMLENVERHRVTHTFMVPSQYLMVLDEPSLADRDVTSLQAMLSAGSTLRHETKDAVIRRFGPVLYELYGTTEGFATMLKPEQQETKADTVGAALIGHRAVVLGMDDIPVKPGEIGEIAGYGGILMREYFGKPEATEASIWRDPRGRTYTRTGDIGRMDVEGFITILDRKKDMIISGGFNLFPADIERIVAGHPDVLDVTVLGIAHPKWDEAPFALVIPRPDAMSTCEAIVEWSNERLAKHQRLAGLEFRTEFPRNALGKVLKRVLRDEIAARPVTAQTIRVVA